MDYKKLAILQPWGEWAHRRRYRIVPYHRTNQSLNCSPSILHQCVSYASGVDMPVLSTSILFSGKFLWIDDRGASFELYVNAKVAIPLFFSCECDHGNKLEYIIDSWMHYIQIALYQYMMHQKSTGSLLRMATSLVRIPSRHPQLQHCNTLRALRVGNLPGLETDHLIDMWNQ